MRAGLRYIIFISCPCSCEKCCLQHSRCLLLLQPAASKRLFATSVCARNTIFTVVQLGSWLADALKGIIKHRQHQHCSSTLVSVILTEAGIDLSASARHTALQCYHDDSEIYINSGSSHCYHAIPIVQRAELPSAMSGSLVLSVLPSSCCHQ